MKDYSELKRLAEAATQGQWRHYQHGVIKGGPVVQFANGSAQQQIVMTTGAEWMRDGEQYDNANFIASANPVAVLELISELQRLAADNASLRGSCAKLGAEHAGMVRTVRKQEKELDGLRKDAGRYRWLRKQNWFDSDISVVRSPNESIKIGYDCPSTERLDDYIDNEMKESKS